MKKLRKLPTNLIYKKMADKVCRKERRILEALSEEDKNTIQEVINHAHEENLPLEKISSQFWRIFHKLGPT